MTKPIRLQLSRQRGFNLQEHSRSINGLEAINVGRPTKWGNPFPVGKPGPLGRVAPDREGSVGFFREMLADPELRSAAGYPVDLSELRGKNLACWCPLGGPCHAEILLELANA